MNPNFTKCLIEESIINACRSFLSEPNDDKTRAAIVRSITDIPNLQELTNNTRVEAITDIQDPSVIHISFGAAPIDRERFYSLFEGRGI